ncbi:hypothetical protein HY085_01455 [Candidatus Gottesmanbacteria bacterium]|nr:hypothetical protein [Candidatus Gottesmanbacteria bacterium]
MNQTMIVTNLRVPADEWHEFKNFASELDVSANYLINQVIKKINVQKSFVNDLVNFPVKHLRTGTKKHDPIWDLAKYSEMPQKPVDDHEFYY